MPNQPPTRVDDPFGLDPIPNEPPGWVWSGAQEFEEPSFQVKDSGARQEFDSGMVRDTTEGKTLWHLVADGPMLERWAVHLTKGAQKYSPGNWLKAEGEEEYERFRQSAFRHFMQWYNGDRDEDHAAAVIFNINGAEYVRTRDVPDKL